ncbi:zinc-finger of transposase IS204/IS1001/IS1096/IS1165, partial [Rheinheimera pacifica]
KRDVPYRDLPIHGKRVTLWVVRRRYTCRACKTTFRPQLPEMVDGFRMTLRLHEYVEKESFNHPYTFVAAQTGLDEKTVRDIFNARAEFLGRWHRFETPRILGIDELYLNKRYRCILTNIEELRDIARLLIIEGSDVNAEHNSPVKGYTPLMLAAELDEGELYSLMLEYGGKPHKTFIDPNTKTANNSWQIAAFWRSRSILALRH